ncbi:phage tail protein [Deinococcus ruber]|uniref:Tail Collar domain-containing protein n=1 Tax=Deinococcus ruber TaxID=1848197 RepID=A0A918CQA9_9DEIO|nr:tail fiber protein [Deinococcus ruber]GGR33239.1 tail Collar domain-containing protein [Deinococcus ruber]
MSTPYLSEIRMMSFNFAPRGWALCNGQLLPINQNQALFSLLGTTYGGNGQTNFALPNLQGRVPIHMGNGYIQGESSGERTHTLTASEVPAHIHPLNASTGAATAIAPASAGIPGGNVLAAPTFPVYAPAGSTQTVLAPAALLSSGGSQPHENMPPYLVMNFCIALQGIFPSRN